MKISIIIPVYNVSSYLRKCVESVILQEYSDWEMVLVDDGSTDESGKICDELAIEHPHVTVIHQNNAGVSSARNKGLNHIHGQWVMMLDADDELMGGALQFLADKMKSPGIDLVTAGYEKCEPDGICHIEGKKEYDAIMSANEYTRCLFCSEDGRYHGYLWTKLFSREIIERHQLRFAEDIYYNEDRLFVYQYLRECTGKCILSGHPVYRYYIRGGGAMQSIKLPGKHLRFHTDLKAFLRMLHECDRQNDPQLFRILINRVIASYRFNCRLAVELEERPEKTLTQLRDMVKGSVTKADSVLYDANMILNKIKAKIQYEVKKL